jgi:hypothetical protein
MATILSYLETHARKKTLRYAVQTAMFCPICESILDVKSAVLLEDTARNRLANEQSNRGE